MRSLFIAALIAVLLTPAAHARQSELTTINQSGVMLMGATTDDQTGAPLKLQRGEKVQVVYKRRDGWLWIKNQAGRSGWVLTKEVKIIAPFTGPRVTWVLVHNKAGFWRELYSTPRVIVLFGASWCDPCHTVKAWWERQPAIGDWKFVYYEASELDPEEEIDAHTTLLVSFVNGADSYPAIALVQGAYEGEVIKNVTLPFHANDSTSIQVCTTDLAAWLHEHPNGTRPMTRPDQLKLRFREEIVTCRERGGAPYFQPEYVGADHRGFVCKRKAVKDVR